MKYRVVLETLMKLGDSNVLMEFFQSLDIDEQSIALEEYKKINIEYLRNNPNPQLQKDIEEISRYIRKIQRRNENEKIKKVELEKAEAELEKHIKEIDEKRIQIRAYLRECIETNASNAKEMTQLAKQMYNLEKEDGLYISKNWTWFEENNIV